MHAAARLKATGADLSKAEVMAGQNKVGTAPSSRKWKQPLHEPAQKPPLTTTLFPKGEGAFAHTETRCSRSHYIHKMLGSVNTTFCRAPEFVWYHFQDNIRRALGNRTQRLVNGRIALDANIDTLNEHCSDIEKQWDLIMAESSFRTARCKSLTLAGLRRPWLAPKLTGGARLSRGRRSARAHFPAKARLGHAKRR